MAAVEDEQEEAPQGYRVQATAGSRGFSRGSLYRGYIGIMDKKMETTI